MLKKVMSYILICFLVIVAGMSVQASSIDNIKIDYSDKVAYTYPIVPGTDEWNSFLTRGEMLKACQIPEEKLKNMSTEALLETVLMYPLISDYFYFNSLSEAYHNMNASFNGLRELVSRKDVMSTIIEEYSRSCVVTASELSKSSPKDFWKSTTLEFLIVCGELSGVSLTNDEKELFQKLMEEKQEQRERAGIYSLQSDIYNNQVNGMARAAGSVWTAVAAGTVRTPSGANVSEVYQRSPNFTTAERAQLNSDTDSKYPRARRGATATVKYNCHSYAWYSQTTSNPYWIGRYSAPTEYVERNNGYILYTGTPYSGVKAWYNNGEHSGVYTGGTIDGAYAIRSKWGMAGLYEHAEAYSPYEYSIKMYVRD